jgi:hypothetical protein
MELDAFLWTIIASFIGTVMGIVGLALLDKAYRIF